MGRFVEASEDIRFSSANRQQLYGWLERVLVQQEYVLQGKCARGLVRRYIEKMTGLSRAQVTRLIARYAATGGVQPTVYRRRRFRSASRGPTSSCWPRSTRRTRH